MFKTLSIVTRWCLKKTFAAFVTAAERIGKFFSTLKTGVVKTLAEGAEWAVKMWKKPSASPQATENSFWSSTKAVAKAVAIQRLLAFIGGFICVFILPADITKGDLTWFENMLTSSKNLMQSVLQKATERTVSGVMNMFTKAGEIT